MASTTRSTVESLEDKGSDPETKDSPTSAKGPPKQYPRPRSASDSSLYSTVGKQGVADGMAGMGAEGGSPTLVGLQGLALVQRGIQMLNLAFPENPGMVAVLADLTGRLQTMVPQLAAQSANMQSGMGGMMGMAMQNINAGIGAAMPPAPPSGPMPPGAAVPPPVPPVS